MIDGDTNSRATCLQDARCSHLFICAWSSTNPTDFRSYA
jgi:hypothetical protein